MSAPTLPPPTVTFDVFGVPAPQGSKTRMPNGAMVEGGSATGRARHRDWRSAVADAANAAFWAETRQIDTPVAVDVGFRFPMPKSRPKRVRELGWAYKPSKPDLDKLCRALGDGLVAGGLLARDELIVVWTAHKIETTGWTGARITIREVGE